MPWGLLAIGAALGVALILFGARAPMLVAVGMYLPFETSAAIFLGGLLRWITGRLAAGYAEADQRDVEETGTLLASGLIAGEAIAGILLAAMFLAGIPSLAQLLSGQPAPAFYAAWGGWLSVAAFAAVAWVLIRLPLRRAGGASQQQREAG